jgi:hypothetical protein
VGEGGEEAEVRRLISLARSEDEEKRMEGARGLVALGPRGTSALMDLGARGTSALIDLYDDEATRFLAAAILLEIGPGAAGAVPRLIEGFDAAPGATLEILRAIGPGAKEALPLVRGLLEPPIDPHLAGAATSALLAIEGPDAFATLARVLEDPEERSRTALLWALAESEVDPTPILPLLTRLLSDEESNVAQYATQAMARVGRLDADAVAALAVVLDEVRSARSAAARILLQSGGADGLAVLRRAARGPDPDDRLAALSALVSAGAEEHGLLDLVLDLAESDAEATLRSGAIALLPALHPPADRVVPFLVGCLDHPRLADAALAALGAIPGDEGRAALRRAVASTRPGVTLQVSAFLLGGEGAREEDLGPLLSLLVTEETPERVSQALWLLRNAKVPKRADRVLPALERHLTADPWRERMAAFGVLADLDGEPGRLVSLLLTGLPEAATRGEAARGLARHPSEAPRSVPALLEVAAEEAGRTHAVSPPVADAIRALAPAWDGTRPRLEALALAASEAPRRALEALARSLAAPDGENR